MLEYMRGMLLVEYDKHLHFLEMGRVQVLGYRGRESNRGRVEEMA